MDGGCRKANKTAKRFVNENMDTRAKPKDDEEEKKAERQIDFECGRQIIFIKNRY